MKYKSSDIEKMIDVFAEISGNKNNPEKIADEIIAKVEDVKTKI